MMAALNSTGAVIDFLGGNAAVAKRFNLKYNSVTNWRMFDRFPPNTYVMIQLELKARGEIAPDYLWGMRNSAVPKRRKSRVG
jgi:hypothetical protein